MGNFIENIAGGIFDFAFGWATPDEPERPQGGVELSIPEPSDEPLIYGHVKNVTGVIVNSWTDDPNDGDDYDNDVLYLQVIWSVGAIESVDQIYLNDLPIDSEAFDHDGDVRWVYHYDYTTQTEITTSYNFSDIPSKPFNGQGFSYSLIVLGYDPEKMGSLPKITADIKGRIGLDDLSGGLTTYATSNPALISWDYLTNNDYGRGIDESQLNKPSFIAERDFANTRVYVDNTQTVRKNIITCNVVLNCNDKLISNIKQLMKGCRGFLPYIDGEFHFLIERVRDFESFEFNDDNKFGSVVISDNEVSERYNKVSVTFSDSAQKGKSATVSYPISASEYNTYLNEDSQVKLEHSVTIRTINNEAEAFQMAEILLKRSRNALKVKTSAGREAKNVNVGMIVPFSNNAFGVVGKPFIITSRQASPNGIYKFEMIEFQSGIYPWVEGNPQVIPDTYLPNYWQSTAPTNAQIEYLTDGTAQAVITWDSTAAEFSYRIFNVNTGVENNSTSSKFVRLTGYSEGDYSIRIQAINRLGYRSRSLDLDFTITVPDTPSLSLTSSNFEITVTPSIVGSEVSTVFELRTSLSSDMSNATYHGQSNAFTLIRLSAGQTYYVQARSVGISGESPWSAVQAITTTSDSTELETVLQDSFPTSNQTNSWTQAQTFISEINVNGGVDTTSGDLNVRRAGNTKIALRANDVLFYDDLAPNVNDTHNIGSNALRFNEIHATDFIENGSTLSNTYLGVNAKAVDSIHADNADKLDNLNSTDFARLNTDSWGYISAQSGAAGGLRIDQSKHGIYSNDGGGGNFSFRVGNAWLNSADTATESGTAFKLRFENDSTNSKAMLQIDGSAIAGQPLSLTTVVEWSEDSFKSYVPTTFESNVFVNNVLPSVAGTYGNLGTFGQQFTKIYGQDLYENNVNIKDKYLNVASLDYDSPELYAVAFSAIDEFNQWLQSGDADTSPYTTVTESIATAFVNTTILQANIASLNQANVQYLHARIIEAGTIVTEQLASKAVTTDKLLVTGAGTTINPDPYFIDQTAWAKLSGSWEFITTNDSPVGSNVLRTTDRTSFYSSTRFPIESGKSYKVSVWAKKVSSGGTMYMRLYTYDADGTRITYTLTGVQPSNESDMEEMVVPSSWTKYVGTVVAPSNAVEAALNIHTNWSTTGVTDLADFRLEEMVEADLIVDGSIKSDKLQSDIILGVDATFLGTVKIGTTDLTASNTFNSNTTASDVGLSNVDNTSDATVLNFAADNANTADKDAGSVGGWTIDTNAIYSGVKDTSGYSSSGITLAASGSIHAKEFYIDTSGNAYFKGDITGANGTFSGTVKIGTTDLTASNTFNSNTTASDVGLSNVDNTSDATVLNFAADTAESFANTAEIAAKSTNNVFLDAGFMQPFKDGKPVGMSNVGGSLTVSLAGIDATNDWGLNYGGLTGRIYQDGGTNNPSNYIDLFTDLYPVYEGEAVGFSIYTGTHRCRTQAWLTFYDSAGVTLTSNRYSNFPYNDATSAGGGDISGYKRLWAHKVAPVGARYFKASIRKVATNVGSSDSFLFYVKPQICYLTEDTEIAPDWVNSTVSADQVNTADKDAGSVGGWTIDTNAIYSGVKDTSGYSSSGITLAASGSIHAKEFYIDTSGNAYFKGDITGANGTFSGTVSGANVLGGNITGAVIATSNDVSKDRTIMDGDTIRVYDANSTIPAMVLGRTFTSGSVVQIGYSGYNGQGVSVVTSNNLASGYFTNGGTGSALRAVTSFGEAVLASSTNGDAIVGTSSNNYGGKFTGRYGVNINVTQGDQPPMVINSSVEVSDLNANYLQGNDLSDLDSRYATQVYVNGKFAVRDPTYTVLYTAPSQGINGGTITLTQDYKNFDHLVVVGGGDDQNDIGNHIIDVTAITANLYRSDQNPDQFLLFVNANLYWRVSASTDGRTLTDRGENCRIFKIYGVNR